MRLRRRHRVELDEVRREAEERRLANMTEQPIMPSHHSPKTDDSDSVGGALHSAANTVGHVIKRQFAQQFRDVPVLGEVFMGHVEDEAEDPDANIPRGVRETTHAEILGDKLRRTWRRFTKE